MTDIEFNAMFGNRLLQARKARHMSFQDLADRLSVVKDTVRRYEAGQASPNIYTLWEICKALDVSADYFIGRQHPRDLVAWSREAHELLISLSEILGNISTDLHTGDIREARRQLDNLNDQLEQVVQRRQLRRFPDV